MVARANLQLAIDVPRVDGGALGLVADVAQFPRFRNRGALDWRATTLWLGVVFRQPNA